MKVVFFGTPEFAAKTLTFLLNHGVNVVAVISKPDRPKGRSGTPVPTPVKTVVQSFNKTIPLFQPEKVSAPEFAPTLEAFKADLFVVVAYGEIIKQHLLDMPKLGCINLHASLLPKYRGAAPIQRAIMEGEIRTGVTIMHMVKKMDAGDIIRVVEIPIGNNDRFPKIEEDLYRAGSQALLEVIEQFSKGIIHHQPQDETQATYASKIELEDCLIDWNQPAEKIHNLVRAVTPDPGAWCYVKVRGERKRLKIFNSTIDESSGVPGSILTWNKDAFRVGCGSNSLDILELQLEGKKPLSAREFMQGLRSDQLQFE